jgi:hypothetical protein
VILVSIVEKQTLLLIAYWERQIHSPVWVDDPLSFIISMLIDDVCIIWLIKLISCHLFLHRTRKYNLLLSWAKSFWICYRQSNFLDGRWFHKESHEHIKWKYVFDIPFFYPWPSLPTH